MMTHARIVIASLAAATATAGAAPTVHTNIGEVRACYPLGGGDFLVGTSGGLVRVDARGEARAVWTAVHAFAGMTRNRYVSARTNSPCSTLLHGSDTSEFGVNLTSSIRNINVGTFRRKS